MTKRRGSVGEAIKKGVTKRGVSNERADRIYRLLLADGPLDSHQIADRLGLTLPQVTGSLGGVEHLLADGRAYAVHGHGTNRMYYATEEGDDAREA